MRPKLKALSIIVLCGLPCAAAAQVELSRNADLLTPGSASLPLRPARPKKISVPVVDGNGRVIAQAQMTQDMRVNTAELLPWAEKTLNDNTLQSLRDTGVVTAGATQEIGFDLDYDAQQALLRMKPAPESLRRQDIALDRGAVTAEITPPVPVSAFLNVRTGVDYLHGGSPAQEGRQPLRADLDGATRVKGFVLESRADYLEDSPAPFRRADTRLVHDLPDRMIRVAAGDLSYPTDGFQGYQPLLGVSLARNFTLQPYRVTEPAGEDSFIIRTPSRVDVMVNGQRTRSLRLEPGPYRVSDFPSADGSNDVTLVITDATGNVETKDFSFFSDRKLLKKGLHEYAYNAGVVADTGGRQTEYAFRRPALSFFHRAGLTDTLTAGLSAQGDADTRQTGLSALRAFSWGTVGADAFASHADGHGFDGATGLSYRLHDAAERRDFSAQAEYRGADFAVLGQTPPVNTSAVETAARYNQIVLDDVGMGLGGRYRFGRAGTDDDWSCALNLSRTFGAAVTATMTAEQRRLDGAGIFLSLVWSPPLSRHSFSTSADTLAGTQNAAWHYRADRALQSFQGSAGITRDNAGGAEATGSAHYAGYRGEASFRHDLSHVAAADRTDSRSTLQLGTGLAYADGHVAVTRPVTGSFVMLARHENLSGHALGINPETVEPGAEAGYQAHIDALGPAVLPDATAYMYRPVKVDTRGLPPGYDIRHDLHTVLPAYKSGTFIMVGNAENVFADGYLRMADGRPAALEGGTAQCGGAEEAQEFFTNAEGRFRINRLAPGSCTLTLYRRPAHSAAFVIPDGAPAGRHDAGELVLEARS